MKTKQKIEILIHPSGMLDIDAVGFSGSDCEQATAFLESALGSISNRQKKPEYYRRQQVNRLQSAGTKTS